MDAGHAVAGSDLIGPARPGIIEGILLNFEFAFRSWRDASLKVAVERGCLTKNVLGVISFFIAMSLILR